MKRALLVGLGLIALILLVAGLTWLLFPRHITTGIPTIVTVHDTVPVVVPRLDTVWRERVRTQVETLPNLVDTVTVQSAPETVTVTLEAVCPQAIQVGQYGKRDAPTVVEGRTFTYDSTRTLLARPWRVTYYTPGPLDAMVGDVFPPLVTFRPAPPKPCGVLCRLGYVALGGLGGVAVTGAACLVSHVP